VLLQHFRGNLDNWDPALIDALARGREVITFDNRGVAAQQGATPSTIAQTALDALDFIDALEVGLVDLLGFSIGSSSPKRSRSSAPPSSARSCFASSAPQGARGMHGWPADAIGAVGKPETSGEEYISVSSRNQPRAARRDRRSLDGCLGRGTDRPRRGRELADPPRAIRRRLRVGTAQSSLLERLSAIDKPTFVANGDSDPMILPHYSYLLAGLIPDARLKIYPDSAHGFLFQHHAEFAADVDVFLTGA